MQLPKVVLKFGGTSVRDGDAIRRAADLVAAELQRRPAVVVSAAAGVTDSLVALLERVSNLGSRPREHQGRDGDDPTQEHLDVLRARHRSILAELELPEDLVEARIDELGDLVHGMQLLREVTLRTRDLVSCYGEFLLAPIFAAHLESRGIPAQAWDGGELGIITDERFTRARPIAETYERIPTTLSGCARDAVPVITGFVGRTACGQVTTLGRGGSDYTASIVGRAIGAEEVQIWTDVDGILTADPRIVPAARRIHSLTFSEASELAYSGAKVLHPSTITPAMDRNIPVRVLNTGRPESEGTTIVGEYGPEDPPLVRAIAHKTGVRVITVVSPRMLDRHGFISRIAGVFDRHLVSIDMISTSEVSVSLTTDHPVADDAAVIRDLESFSSVEVEGGRGMVSVVGGGLGESSSVVGDIFQIVSTTGAQIEMISYGAARTNLSFLIEEQRVPEVVSALHVKYFGSA